MSNGNRRSRSAAGRAAAGVRGRRAAAATAAAAVAIVECTAEERKRAQDHAMHNFWTSLPELSGSMVEIARGAMKPLTRQGEVIEWVPDYYMRVQAWDRIYRATLQPLLESQEQKPPIMIYNAIQGVYAEEIMSALSLPENAGIRMSGNIALGNRLEEALRGNEDHA